MNNTCKLNIYALIAIGLIHFSGNVLASHIGDVKVVKIRHWSADSALITISPAIPSAALPGCATNGNNFMLTSLGDDGFSQRRFAMLLTAKTTGALINPNCTNTCTNLWFGSVVNCVEMTIQ